MSQQLTLPELGENIKSATVLKVLVSPGDRIRKDQNVLELETEKTVAEVPSDIEGVVEEIHVDVGDEVEVGQLLITLRNGAKDTAEPAEAEESEDRGRVEGEPAEASEEGRRADVDEGEAAVEEEPDDEEPSDRATTEREPASPEPESAEPEHKASAPLPAAPSVRRRARELDVDLHRIRGSGPRGRISEDDVVAFAQKSEQKKGRPAPRSLPDVSRWGDVEFESMSKVRRLTAEGMSQAWAAVPHAVQFGKADIAQVEALRDRFQGEAEEADGHLSMSVVLVKIIAGALRAFPRFNASVDEENDGILYKKYVHIGVAVATERGLVVPVVRDVDRKSLLDLSVEIKAMTAQARDGKLSVDDMQGGCMTLTNGGALGGDMFIPIVNWPEAAILGAAQTVIEPRFEGGAFRPRRMLPLSLSYDHRLIDGADAIQFMNWIVQTLEDPLTLIWHG